MVNHPNTPKVPIPKTIPKRFLFFSAEILENNASTVTKAVIIAKPISHAPSYCAIIKYNDRM